MDTRHISVASKHHSQVNLHVMIFFKLLPPFHFSNQYKHNSLSQGLCQYLQDQATDHFNIVTQSFGEINITFGYLHAVKKCVHTSVHIICDFKYCAVAL